jgi:hypothetical protein
MDGSFVKKLNESKEKKAAVYGCLYMDQGETSWEYAEKQIDGSIVNSKRAPEEIVVGFDLICTKNQINNAKILAERIFKYILERYPKIYAHTVGITNVEEYRPARDILMNRNRFTEFVRSHPKFDANYFILYENISEFLPQTDFSYKASEGKEKNASIYARELREIKERDCPNDHEIKFKKLIESCKVQKTIAVSIEDLGSDYQEVLENLSIISKAKVRLELFPVTSVEFPDEYKEKFTNLFKLRERTNEAKTVLIAFPEILGDDYSEIVLSLSFFAISDLGLFIAHPNSEAMSGH